MFSLNFLNPYFTKKIRVQTNKTIMPKIIGDMDINSSFIKKIVMSPAPKEPPELVLRKQSNERTSEVLSEIFF